MDDVTAKVRALAAQGAVFNRYTHLSQDADAILALPDGLCVAWFSDPDGNVLSVSNV